LAKRLVVYATLDNFVEVNVLDDDQSTRYGIDVGVDQLLRSGEIGIVGDAIFDLFLHFGHCCFPPFFLMTAFNSCGHAG
jgi:hypothetical protein